MTHIHTKPGQVDFTATVYIVYKDKVLLRKHEKYGIWLGPGGHIEPEEDPNQAAIREAKEEIGLDIELEGEVPVGQDKNRRHLISPVFLNRHPINEHHDHVDMIYFAQAKTADVMPENHDDEWHWFTADEIHKNEQEILPDIAAYAFEALRRLGK